MARGIHQVENIVPAVFCLVWQADGLAFDRDAPFPLDVHIVKELVPEFPIAYHLADLDEPVGKGGFTVIDMGYDAKVPDVIHEMQALGCCASNKARQ